MWESAATPRTLPGRQWRSLPPRSLPRPRRRLNATRRGSRCRARRGITDRFLDLQPGVADVAQPALRVLLETPREQALDRRGCGGGQCGPVRLAREDRREDIADGVAGKRGAARERLAEHNPERPDVRSLVYRLAPRLLRGHVGGRAENHAAHRERSRTRERRRVQHVRPRPIGRRWSRQAEIQHFHRTVGTQPDVAGFRSRWTIPCSCAASSASAICRAIGRASETGIGLPAMR
jgi:hypothetical protein